MSERSGVKEWSRGYSPSGVWLGIHGVHLHSRKRMSRTRTSEAKRDHWQISCRQTVEVVRACRGFGSGRPGRPGEEVQQQY